MPGLTGLALLDVAMALIPALVTAYAVVMGGVALAAGWQFFRSEPPRRFRRGAVMSGRGAHRDRGDRGAR